MDSSFVRRSGMWDIVEGIHKALRIESTWAFVCVIALGAALVAGFVAWIIDAGYRNSAEYKAEHPSPKVEAVVSQNSEQSPTTAQTPQPSSRQQEANGTAPP